MAKEKAKTIEQKLKDGEIEIVTPEDPSTGDVPSVDFTKITFESFIPVLVGFRGLKKTLTSAPAFIPKNFSESVQFYDTGGVRRLYLYVNKAWRYVVLT